MHCSTAILRNPCAKLSVPGVHPYAKLLVTGVQAYKCMDQNLCVPLYVRVYKWGTTRTALPLTLQLVNAATGDPIARLTGAASHLLEQGALHFDCCCWSVRTHLAADSGCKCHCRSTQWKVQQLWSGRCPHVDVDVFDTAQQSHNMAQVDGL